MCAEHARHVADRMRDQKRKRAAAAPRAPRARPYHCGVCGGEGHQARTCPTIEHVEHPRTARVERIAIMLQAELTLAEIGAAIGISGERVLQVIGCDEGLTSIYRLAQRTVEDRAAIRRGDEAEAQAEREQAKRERRDTIAAMLAAGCSFVEIGAALGVHYKGPLHSTRRDPELQAIYEAATELRRSRTREKMSAAHTRG